MRFQLHHNADRRLARAELLELGLELREMDIPEDCCGFGGTFSVKFAEVSGGMARTKVAAIERTGASASTRSAAVTRTVRTKGTVVIDLIIVARPGVFPRSRLTQNT